MASTMSGAISATRRILLTYEFRISFLRLGDLGDREDFFTLYAFSYDSITYLEWRNMRPRLGCAASLKRRHAASVVGARPIRPVRGMGTQWRQ